MDPITLGISAVGLGLKLAGGFGAAGNASQIASLSSANAGLAGQVNQQRQQAMELSARRQQLEMYRNTQRARAMGLNSAVSQGAQFGSGLPGGQASTTAQGAFNVQGVNQNLQIGQNIFGLEGKESTNNMQIASLKGSMATNEGWASLGGSLLSSAGTIGQMGKSASGMFGNIGNLFMGGGSPSGL